VKGKDDRLYARFDIAMDEHPKIMLLSDAAFRALIEATFYCRRQLTDGFLDERVAMRKWGREVLDELASNHSERPSLTVVQGGWCIRDYAEHQTTRADIERKRAAGRAGGLAKAKQTSSRNVAGARKPHTEPVYQNATTPLAITKTETETTTTDVVVKSAAERGTRLPDAWMPSTDLLEWARSARTDVDVDAQVEAFRDYWMSQPGQRARKSNWDLTFKNWIRNSRATVKGKASQTDRFHDTIQMGRELQAEIDRKAIA
jgi:hypothetical protein